MFVRTTQIDLVAGIAGTVMAGLLSLWFLSLPMIVSGVGLLGLAGWLALVMPERNFVPGRRSRHRETFGHMARTARDGMAAGPLTTNGHGSAAGQPVRRIGQRGVRPPVDGPDRPGLPSAAAARGGQPRCLVRAFALVGSVVALLASLVSGELPARRAARTIRRRLLAVCAAVQMLCVVGVALGRSSGLALAALWSKAAVRSVAAPLEAAWLNRELRSDVRATVLSMNAQVNAIGQVCGGPPLGALAGRTSVTVALLAAAALLAPTAGIFAWLGRRKHLT